MKNHQKKFINFVLAVGTLKSGRVSPYFF